MNSVSILGMEGYLEVNAPFLESSKQVSLGLYDDVEPSACEFTLIHMLEV